MMKTQLLGISKKEEINFMRKIELEELRRIQISILDVVTDFCEKHAINYWIDSGTLLGAIRHKGYIPWDDDIDIGMLREDYDKFMDLFNKHNSRYKFYCIENNPNFLYPHGKVLDTTTVLYEPDKKGNKLSVNIDIFVYDNAPNEDDKVEKMYDRRDKYRRLQELRCAKNKPRGNIIRRIFVHLVRGVLHLFPKNYFIKKILKNSRRYVNAKTVRVGNFTAYSRIACDKSIFNEFIKVEFEGKEYNAPIGYDAWLTAFYKDYMTLPPEEKRVSHHTFEAYIEEEKAK